MLTHDTSQNEEKIDVLIFKHYGLTFDEVKIINPEFSLTQNEYESIVG